MKKLYVFLILAMLLPLVFSCGENETSNESTTSIPTEISLPDTDNMQELLDSDTFVEKTISPEIVEGASVTDGRGVISGYCEKGAVIYFVREGKVLKKVNSVDGTFLAEFEIKQNDSPLILDIYAKTDSKGFSESAEVRLFYKTKVEEVAQDIVRFGSDGWLFFTNTEPQYTNNEVLDEKTTSSITRRAKQKVDWLKSNKDAELIYLLIPNTNEIYSENMPSEIVKGEKSLMDQVGAALAEGGATVITITDDLFAHKDDGFDLYHKTDSHWTEYGAYFGYKAIFDHISKKFPAAAPRPISDFTFERVTKDAGDLYFDLGFDETKFKVTSTFATEKFETGVDMPKYMTDNATRINEATMEYMEFSSGNSELPNIYVMRDSYSVMMFDWIAERCQNVIYKPLWEFGFRTKEIENIDVDYVIYIICEMNIMSILR